MKREKSAFTLMELLVVLGVIIILVAIIIPAATMVRNTAKETQQKAQLTTIEMGLTAFKNDYGDYPPSHGSNNSGNPDYAVYCGAQTLAEALVGWDLLGFHPKSAWRADGEDKNGGNTTYDPAKNRDNDGDNVPDTLKERTGPYLEVATSNVFRLGNISAAKRGLFNDTKGMAGDTYVICDVFGVRRMTIGLKAVRAGTPILYYRANTASKTFDPNASSQTDHENNIYNAWDNIYLILLESVTADGSSTGSKDHLLGDSIANAKNLYKPDCGEDGIYGIKDSKITTLPDGWPHRPDSYILISAGVDGLYGTRDDVRNF